jgi:hypothetical protein
LHLAQFHPVHSVHSEGEIFVKAAPSHYATSLCPCHYVGTLVPPQWHDCDMPLAHCANRVAQAWHYIGCSKGAAERDLM